ncbi:MAG: hypothetical protein U5L10_02495 [Candidatus Moranbacteria bacterium]|nr:hypothetical protein [Candidatus Moranbacteria bacterium]
MFWKNANWAVLQKKDLGNGNRSIDLNSGFESRICSPSPKTRVKNINLKLKQIEKKGIKEGALVKIPDGRILEVTGICKQKGELILKDYKFLVNPISVEVV